jgi:hypothetical protein
MKGKRVSKRKIKEAGDAYHIKQAQMLMAAFGYVPDLSKHGEYVRMKNGDVLCYEPYEGFLVGPLTVAKCADGTLELLCDEKTVKVIEGQPVDLSRLRKVNLSWLRNVGRKTGVSAAKDRSRKAQKRGERTGRTRERR